MKSDGDFGTSEHLYGKPFGTSWSLVLSADEAQSVNLLDNNLSISNFQKFTKQIWV